MIIWSCFCLLYIEIHTSKMSMHKWTGHCFQCLTCVLSCRSRSLPCTVEFFSVGSFICPNDRANQCMSFKNCSQLLSALPLCSSSCPNRGWNCLVRHPRLYQSAPIDQHLAIHYSSCAFKMAGEKHLAPAGIQESLRKLVGLRWIRK